MYVCAPSIFFFIIVFLPFCLLEHTLHVLCLYNVEYTHIDDEHYILWCTSSANLFRLRIDFYRGM